MTSNETFTAAGSCCRQNLKSEKFHVFTWQVASMGVPHVHHEFFFSIQSIKTSSLLPSLFRKLPRVRAVSCYNYDQQAQVHICASPLCVFPHTYHHLCVSLVGKHKILSPQTATMKELYGPEETYFISHLFPYSYVFRIGLKMMYVVLSICRLRQHCSFV